METFKAAVNLAVGLAFGAAALKGIKTLWGLVQDEPANSGGTTTNGGKS